MLIYIRVDCVARLGLGIRKSEVYHFDSLSSCEERRAARFAEERSKPFQSTCLLRGTTVIVDKNIQYSNNIYTTEGKQSQKKTIYLP